MSELKVNKVTPRSGTTVTLGDSGDTITIPSGVTITNDGTQTGFGGTNTPAFMAYRTSSQSISNATFTKIEFSTEVFDTDNCYDNATNYRFTPTTAGKYFINFNLGFQNWIQEKYYFIHKNGAVTSLGVINNHVGSISAIVDANGSTDYFEAYVYQASGSPQTIDFSEVRNNFFAYKLIGV